MGNDESIYRFGAFELQSRERRLLMAGHSLPVGPRAFDVLVALVERAGRLVTKDDLLDLVWPKLVVEENNLHVQVSALRKLLGPEAIATVSGRGYRFTLALERTPAMSFPRLAGPTHNLPEQVTSFVGRERELAEIGALLGSHRLLTLLGVGGVGKTRLALEAAGKLLGDYSSGVWFAELAPLADAELVPQAVASVLGVREEAGRPTIEALVKFVKERRLLLVLDNCEHLAPACAELARQVLRSGSQVKIMATSRDYLHVAGETTYPVPPLGVPKQQAVNVIAIMQSEAVRLFADRTAASHPSFHVTPHNAPAIAAICRHLEGIPLAIELAAARVRALSVEKIAERLGDRFRLLNGGDPTALPRQQTLRACIDWSYELLGEREKALLRRLSVFAGGWTLEAAEAVCAGGEVAASDVLDLLTRLVEKSLVALEADDERYQMLETVRQYAQERLDDSGEAAGVRERHLAFYLSFAEEAADETAGPEQGTWYRRLDLERENYLAAHARCAQTAAGGEAGSRMVFAMRRYWIHRDGLKLGYGLAMAALQSAQARSLARCQGLYAAAKFASSMGRYAEAQGCLLDSLSIAREIGDEERITMALHSLGEQYYAEGKLTEARRHFEEALPLARRLEARIPRIAVLGGLAELNRAEGKLEAAHSLFKEGLALAREIGDLADVVIYLINLSCVSIALGSGRPSPELLREALAIVEQLGSRLFGAIALHVSAGLAAYLGEFRRAAQQYGVACAQFEEIGHRPDPADEAFLAPLMAKAREALGAAAFVAAENEGRALSYEDALAETRDWLEERPPLRAVR